MNSMIDETLMISRHKYRDFFTKEEQEYIKDFYKKQIAKGVGISEYRVCMERLKDNMAIPYYAFLEIMCHIDLLKYDYKNYLYTKLETNLRKKCKEQNDLRPKNRKCYRRKNGRKKKTI